MRLFLYFYTHSLTDLESGTTLQTPTDPGRGVGYHLVCLGVVVSRPDLPGRSFMVVAHTTQRGGGGTEE